MKQFCIFLAIIAVAAATSESDGLLSTALNFVKNCGEKSMILCVKERALRYIDETDGDIEISESIKLVEIEKSSEGRSMTENNLSDEPEVREGEVDSLLVSRVSKFLGSHTLQFKMPKDSIQDMQRSLEEARGKGKKTKKLLLPLLMLFKLKAAALLPLAIGALALISFKALIIGKLALILSAIIGLKKLFEGKHTSSYEVVAHPHHSYSSSYGESDHHGAFRRSVSVDAQKMAYSAHN